MSGRLDHFIKDRNTVDINHLFAVLAVKFWLERMQYDLGIKAQYKHIVIAIVTGILNEFSCTILRFFKGNLASFGKLIIMIKGRTGHLDDLPDIGFLFFDQCGSQCHKIKDCQATQRKSRHYQYHPQFGGKREIGEFHWVLRVWMLTAGNCMQQKLSDQHNCKLRLCSCAVL